MKTWIDRKDTIWISECFLEIKSSGASTKVELDLPNYATKAV